MIHAARAAIDVEPLVRQRTVTETGEDGAARQVTIDESDGSRSCGHALAIACSAPPPARTRPRDRR